MKTSLLLVVLFLGALGNVKCFQRMILSKMLLTQVSASPAAALSSSIITLAAEVATKPDGYVYGAVEAPPFVPIFAAIAVIAIAGIPFLLRPGEQALEEQRNNEKIKGNEFGSGDSVGKRNKKL